MFRWQCGKDMTSFVKSINATISTDIEFLTLDPKEVEKYLDIFYDKFRFYLIRETIFYDKNCQCILRTFERDTSP